MTIKSHVLVIHSVSEFPTNGSLAEKILSGFTDVGFFVK